MNILITGAIGHIGSKLIDNLSKIKKLKKVYLIDNARSNNLNVLFNLKYKKIKLIFIKDDLIFNRTLLKVKNKIDIVIHLASITNAEGSFKIKKLMLKNNFGIFKKICNFCHKKKCKLIHLSSTSVYGSESGIVDETSKKLNPESPYAEIKILEENFLKKQKFDYITLRLGTITGISNGMRFHTAVNKFCLNTVLRQKLPIWNNAIDKHRPYLSLNDAANTIFFIINKKIFNKQIYNVVTKNYTVNEILSFIRLLNYSPKLQKVRSRILNQSSYKVSRKKIELLGVKFSKSIRKDVKETLNLFESFY